MLLVGASPYEVLRDPQLPDRNEVHERLYAPAEALSVRVSWRVHANASCPDGRLIAAESGNCIVGYEKLRHLKVRVGMLGRNPREEERRFLRSPANPGPRKLCRRFKLPANIIREVRQNEIDIAPARASSC